jgi:hypothetical protein
MAITRNIHIRGRAENENISEEKRSRKTIANKHGERHEDNDRRRRYSSPTSPPRIPECLHNEGRSRG